PPCRWTQIPAPPPPTHEAAPQTNCTRPASICVHRRGWGWGSVFICGFQSSMNANHLSFGAQAMRYFQRPHDAVLRQPLGVPAAWRGAEMRQRDDWIVRLTPAEIAELERAADAATARGLGLDAVRREDFPLPTLARTIAGWSRELAVGRGFLLLRGLPVHRWGEARASLVYWGLGQYLGEPGAQNPQGELLGHVTDYGEDAANPFV